MTEPIKCSSLAANGSDFTLLPAASGVTIVSASSAVCSTTTSATVTYQIKLSGALPNGTYALKAKNGTDNNTLLDNCGNTQPIGDSVNFIVSNPLPPVFNLVSPATCTQKAVFTLTPSPAGTYGVVIRSGTTAVRTRAGVSGVVTDSLVAGSYVATFTNSAGCANTVAFTLAAPPAVSVTAIASNICLGAATGSAVATGAGGTGSYTYSWNTTPVQNTATATGLAAGTYTVTVRDSFNCTATRAVTIGTYPAITITTSKTDASCNGGSTGTATASPANGTAPYTYSWNTTPAQTTATASNLAAGTYTVTATDANGCSATAQAIISQPTAVSGTTTTTPTNCNSSTGTATVTATGGTGPYTYSWNTTPAQTTATATGLAAGTYTVTITDAKGCTATAQAIVSQPSSISVTATATAVSCNGGSNGSATASAANGASPYSYSWNTTPIHTTATATGLGAGTYTVTATDANGCSATAQAIVTQPTAITATVTKTDVSCYGGSNGTATATATGGTGAYTYSWNTTPAQTTATATGLTAGTYTVTITDANGCTQTAQATIAQPTVITAITSKTDANCNGGNTGTATVAATGGTGPYSYSWNTTPVQTTATASNLAAGTYTVTITDAKGCTKTAQAIVSQPTAITATIAKTDASCNGNTNGTATVTATGGTGAYAYSWNTTPIQTTATATNLAAGTYTVTITDANGCTKTAQTTIIQPAVISLSTTVTPVACYGNTNGTATVTATSGTGPYSYSWNATPVQTNATASNLAAGTYTVTVTDANGCTKTAQAIVTQPAVFSITAASTPVDCNGGYTGTATATVLGGTAPYTYSWNTTPIQTAATATNLAAGTYTVVATDSRRCTATATTTVTQPPALVLTTALITNACAGVAGGEVSVTATGGTGTYTYSWNTTPIQTTATATGFLPGTYTVTVRDSLNCPKTGTITVTTREAAVVNAGNDRNLCAGDSTQLTTSGNGVSWQWTASNSSTLSCYQCAAPIAKPTATTTYTVTVQNAAGCTAADTITLTIPVRQPVSIGAQQTICTGDSVTLSATGGVAYEWSPAQSLSSATIGGPVAHPTATTNYRVIITQNECYKDTLFQKITVVPRPTVQLPADFNGMSGAVMPLNAVITNAQSIQWTPAAGLSCADCPNPTVTLSNTVTYYVTVKSTGNCNITDTLNIGVTCDGSRIYTANTFTPNGDGLDDWFYPQGSNVATIKRMAIFNRWGEQVFEAHDFQANDKLAGWNGTYKGVPLPPDVFGYVLEAFCADGTPIYLKGDINLIK